MRALIMRAPPIASKDRLWSRKDCARYLRYDVRTMERVAKLPNFPHPLRPGGGHPRWLAAEIIEWVKQGCVEKW
jgi:predicted DNA-binding transcriptional regulator AlpA